MMLRPALHKKRTWGRGFLCGALRLFAFSAVNGHFNAEAMETARTRN
jgi:hypothetical protein